MHPDIVIFRAKGNEKSNPVNYANASISSKVVEVAKQTKSGSVIAVDCGEYSLHTVNYVVEFMEHHAGKDMQIISPLLPDDLVVDKWDIVFITSVQHIREFTNLVYYLNIPGLLSLCCAYVAQTMYNTRIEEFAKFLEVDERESRSQGHRRFVVI